MKRFLLAVSLFTAFTSAFAQNSQPGCYPFPKTISVTGSAEMNIIPDEIYVQVTLREYKKKGEEKTEIEKIKTAFLASCREIGIPDSNIAVASFEGYNMTTLWRRRKRDPDLYASIIYEVKFSNSKKIDELVDKLDDEATTNFFISRTSHSRMSEYRKQLKIMAVKAAREKAIYLTEAVNEQLGQAITISEPVENSSSDISQMQFKSRNYYANKDVKYEGKVDADDGNGPDFRKIKLRYEVTILYALK